jgi:hypothetical protein
MNTLPNRVSKASTYLILAIILILASALTLTPRAYSQAASVTFQLQDGLVKVEVTSPVDVYQFQLAIVVPSGASLDPSKAVLTGFMQNSNQLSEGGEYRWFNLNAAPSKTGSLTVPSTGLGPDNLPRLIRLDLLDSQGNRIDLQQTLPLTATIAAAATVTTTVTETRTVTITSTITQPTTVTTTQTATITKTTTITQPTTVTTTITSTLTQPTTVTSTQTETKTVTQPTTVTSTQTVTQTTTLTTTTIKEVPVDATPYIAAIIALIIIIIILAILLVRRRS